MIATAEDHRTPLLRSCHFVRKCQPFFKCLVEPVCISTNLLNATWCLAPVRLHQNMCHALGDCLSYFVCSNHQSISHNNLLKLPTFSLAFAPNISQSLGFLFHNLVVLISPRYLPVHFHISGLYISIHSARAVSQVLTRAHI